MNYPSRVYITEVGPRDGLQNEQAMVAVSDKLGLIERLLQAGIRHFEATSFVSPKWVPQMRDAQDVMAALQAPALAALLAPATVSVLTPNMKGLEAALAAGAQEVVVFGAASEAFSHKNINCSIAESMAMFEPVVAAAHAAGVATRGAISCAVGCPYEGAVAPAKVADVARMMNAMGVQRIAVADTIGVGTPRAVQAALEAALQHYDIDHVAGHFHDTYGQALSNTLAALQIGVNHFESSIAGLGGCPYAKGATGNVATEDVVYMLHGMGIDTGIDVDKLVDAAAFISNVLGRQPNSRVSVAMLNKRLASSGTK
jgi:hydroxymethylglutaryl-CoA lyase